MIFLIVYKINMRSNEIYIILNNVTYLNKNNI